LRFNDQTLAYSIERDFVTQLPYQRNMEAVQTYIFGKELLDLTLVADHSWEVQFLKDDLEAMISIWQLGSDPSIGRISEFGDFDNDNIADENAPEIRVNGDAGYYLLRFNDSNMHYEVIPLM
jgi:hypothetical protein